MTMPTDAQATPTAAPRHPGTVSHELHLRNGSLRPETARVTMDKPVVTIMHERLPIRMMPVYCVSRRLAPVTFICAQ